MRFEDFGFDEMEDDSRMDAQTQLSGKNVFAPDTVIDEGIDVRSDDTPPNDEPTGFDPNVENLAEGGVVRTLDGEIAGDEFAQDAINYQLLLGKIDRLLDNLMLDA